MSDEEELIACENDTIQVEEKIVQQEQKKEEQSIFHKNKYEHKSSLKMNNRQVGRMKLKPMKLKNLKSYLSMPILSMYFVMMIYMTVLK